MAGQVPPSVEYEDERITCTSTFIAIRAYYFPTAGSKRISYASIRGAEQRSMGRASGKGRIWGTANPRLWANLDPDRRHKDTGFVLDTGRSVRPLLTPDDPVAFRRVLESHGLPVTPGAKRFI